MSKVRDLLIARRDEIQAEIGPLQAEVKEIDAALAAIEPKASVRKAQKRAAAKGKLRRSGTQKAKGQRARQPSIADQSIDLLNQNPDGFETEEIARKLEENYGRKTTTRTLSTQLSAMKRQGRLSQEGKVWKLPTTRPETADEGTPTVAQAE